MRTYIDYAPIAEDIDTVGDLQAFLEDFDDDMPVRVNDDGRVFDIKPHRRKFNNGLVFLEL